jgi:hypothetical protein
MRHSIGREAFRRDRKSIRKVGGTKPSHFAADVTQLEMLVELITTRKGCFGPTHPIFGSMSNTDWMRWAYLHMDHHLRQFGC